MHYTLAIRTFNLHKSIDPCNRLNILPTLHKTSLVRLRWMCIFEESDDDWQFILYFFAGPYQNIPFSNYYAAAAAAVERRSGAIMSHTLEPFDNKSSPSPHERMAAYAHSSLTALTTLSTRNPSGEADDERLGPGNAPHGAGSSEFSGLVSYFSSQQDDLDS